MKRYSYILLLFLWGAPSFAGYTFPIGEKAVYKVQWGMVTCGTSTIQCDEVVENGKTLIRIRIHAKSNWLASSVYPVDDTVDCFIDPETNKSIRLEKSTSEGGFVCKDVLRFDRINNRAQWDSESRDISTNYTVNATSCDAVSFLYALRQQSFKINQTRSFDMAVDATLHKLEITAQKSKKKRAGTKKKVRCKKFKITPKRDDLFVRKIPEEIWITDDTRKIMVKMTVKVPVGSVSIELDEYTPGKSKKEINPSPKK